MKLARSLFLLVLLIVFSCSSGDGSSDEIPITNETPDNDGNPIITVSFCDVNNALNPEPMGYGENGLSVNMDLPSNLSLDDATEYGYLLKRIYDSEEFKYDLSDSGSSSFQSSIRDLIEGFEYQLTGYAMIGGNTCRTNSLTFVSEGNYFESPWSPYPNGFILNPLNSYGVSVDGETYMLMHMGDFYKINNDGTLENRSDFPKPGSTDSKNGYTIFDLGGFAYVKSTYNNEIYRYDQSMDSWEEVGNIDNNVGTFSGQLEGIGYTFDNTQSFSYVPGGCCFSPIGDGYNTSALRSTFQTESDIYAINRDYEILRFNKSEGTFSIISNYPGEKIKLPLVNDDIISLVQGNMAYIGMTLKYEGEGSTNLLDIHELNLDTMEWKELESFPVPFKSRERIGQVNGELYSYIFYNYGEFGENSSVWKFDSSKVVYIED